MIISSESDKDKFMSFSELLYEYPEKCPGKFQLRVDEVFLAMLGVGACAQFLAFITDLEIMSCVDYNMKVFTDKEECQQVYEFTRKIKKGSDLCHTS